MRVTLMVAIAAPLIGLRRERLNHCLQIAVFDNHQLILRNWSVKRDLSVVRSAFVHAGAMMATLAKNRRRRWQAPGHG